MTKPLSKTDLTRAAWLTELRRQGHRQCQDALRIGTRVCAIGLLGEVANAKERQFSHGDDYGIGALAGLSHDQVEEVTKRNDGAYDTVRSKHLPKHTFAEIADVVEGWFPAG